MALSELPEEIHELIIDAAIAKRVPWMVEHRKKTLSACALVCKRWYSIALRRTFHDIQLPRDVGTASSVLGLIERKSEILECIKSISVAFHPHAVTFNDDDFEKFCRLCTNASRLSLVFDMKLDSHPLIRNGILLLLKSPSLRHLSLSCSKFKTSLFEPVSQHLATLSLHDVVEVVLDHQDSSKLVKSLKKVQFHDSLSAIRTMHNTAPLCLLFEQLQHLNIYTDARRLPFAPLWGQKKLDWANCTSVELSLHFLFELDEAFSFYFQDFPWLSLSALKRLKLDFLLAERRIPSTLPQIGWVSNSSHTFFLSGPSRLKHLESLDLNYRFLMPFRASEYVYQTLKEIGHDSLEPNFRRRDSDTFSSLKNLSLHFRMSGVAEVLKDEVGMTRQVLGTRVVDHLPSVFGAGGRCEVDGLVAQVGIDWIVIHWREGM